MTDLERLRAINQRFALIMGYMFACLERATEHLSEDEKRGYNWCKEAIDYAIHLEKPLPPFP